MNEDDVKLYTVKETARLLGVNLRTVYKLVHGGLLPCIKLGALKIRACDIKAFLDKWTGYRLEEGPKSLKMKKLKDFYMS